jgi:TBCC domain-containing protein 1
VSRERGRGGGVARRASARAPPPLPPSSPVHVSHSRSTSVARKELADHLAASRAALGAYAAHAARAAPALVGLAADAPPLSGPPPAITALEFDRLGFLLRPAGAPSRWRGVAPGSGGGDEMETDAPPPLPPPRLSAAAPLFAGVPDGAPVPGAALAAWLAAATGDAPAAPGEAAAAAAAAAAAGPPSPFDDPLPPAGVVDGGEVDVQGVCRATVARGEAAFPSGVLRVADCHDAVVYALAPLAHACIVACSDCTIVLGAVGRCVRLERCERVTLVAAARRAVVDSCHDCTLSLGVNGRPLVLGSSRGVVLGPHCAG